MPEATPRPWPAVGHDNDTGLSDDSYFEWWEIEGVARFYGEADAELARRAVNSHDALVSALERAQQDIVWMLNNRQFLNPDTFDYLDAALAQAQEQAR